MKGNVSLLFLAINLRVNH